MRTTLRVGLAALVVACGAAVRATPSVSNPRLPPERAASRASAPSEGSSRVTVAEVSPPSAPPEERAPEGPWEGFFRALEGAEGRLTEGRVGVVILGDSHTEDGTWAARVRARLGARFGDRGRGLVTPGRVRFHAQGDVSLGAEGVWAVSRGPGRGDPRRGLAGVRAHAPGPGATVWVGTCGACASTARTVSRFEVFFGREEGGPGLLYRLDGEPWRPLGAPGERSFATVTAPEGAHRLTLRPDGPGEVSVYGVALEREGPGVVVDSLGVVGAQASHLASWDWTVLGPQLARRAPSLVVLQYGTNEAVRATLDLARFEEGLVALVGRVRSAAPGASVLLLGPPDLARRDPLGRWVSAPRVAEVVEAERRAAERSGAAFFDVYRALGGEGSMASMATERPPLAWPDHLHLTPRGYARSAELFLAEVLSRYDAWRASRPP